MQATVLALALKTASGGPMEEVQSARGEAGAGLLCPVKPSPKRGITLLSAPQWEQVTRELETDLPWHTRRANVLLDCGSMAELIGKTVQIGELRIEVNDETHPCATMDALHKGLTRVLVPECRGGVLGRILEGGEIKVGDTLTVVE